MSNFFLVHGNPFLSNLQFGDITPLPPTEFFRITEDDQQRITEDGEVRIIE